MKTFRLYALPSFWSGAARLVDLGGTFDKYNTSASDEAADARALASDLAYVGRDLFQAARHLASTMGIK